MGTNYYLIGYPDMPSMHIGKSSVGWCFSLHVYPDMDIHDLNNWIPLFLKYKIENEYGDTIKHTDMQSIIVDRSRKKDWKTDWWNQTINGKPCYESEEDFHSKNYSLRGPKGLLRHQINQYCIKHGLGTWDCIVGYFS
jgi:hypothetical protein